jgi:hypothetical protein
MPGTGCGFARRHLDRMETLRSGLEKGQDGRALLEIVRALVGTRPNEAELARVFREGALK